MSDTQIRSESQPGQATTEHVQHRHPLIIAAAAYAVIAGVVALIMGFFGRYHPIATILGITALMIGLWAQMVSATRIERIFIVFGIVTAFVGMGLGIAHGGFG